MRIEYLNYLKTIAQYDSLSQAAEALYLNQPTLSRILTTIEKELNVQLFYRSHQGMLPTPVCQKLLPHFDKIIKEMETVQSTINHENLKDVSGVIDLCATSIICNSILLDIITTFNQSYPLVSINVAEKYLSDALKSVYRKTVDIGFLTTNKTNTQLFLDAFNLHNITYEFLMGSPVVAVISAHSPLTKKAEVTTDELQQYPYFPLQSTKSLVLDVGPIQNVHFCLNRETSNKLIIKQNGYTVLPAFEIENDIYLQQGLLALRPIKTKADDLSEIKLWLIYNKDRKWTDYEEDFLTIARQAFLNCKSTNIS